MEFLIIAGLAAHQKSVIKILPITESLKASSKEVLRRRCRRNTPLNAPFSRRRRENGANDKTDLIREKLVRKPTAG